MRFSLKYFLPVLALCAAPSMAYAVQVEKSNYGTTAAGDQITQFKLTNAHGISVSFITYGATLTRMDVPDRNGKMANILLSFSNLADYEKYNNDPHFGALIGRFANRIAKGTFSLAGQTYHLPINNPPNSLHSGPDDFGIKTWKSEEIQRPNGAGVQLTYVSPDGQSGLPGNLTAKIDYWLDEKDSFHIHYQATTDKPTIVNLTNHAYFNLGGENSGSILRSHWISIAANHFTPTDATQIPTGEIKDVTGTAFDLRQPTNIGQSLHRNWRGLKSVLGYDHNFILDATERLGAAVIVRDSKSGRVMTLQTTQPAVQFYTGNNIGKYSAGSGGVVYQKYSGFALETQHFPDSPNKPNFPTTTLNPGEVLDQETIYRFMNDKYPETTGK